MPQNKRLFEIVFEDLKEDFMEVVRDDEHNVTETNRIHSFFHFSVRGHGGDKLRRSAQTSQGFPSKPESLQRVLGLP